MHEIPLIIIIALRWNDLTDYLVVSIFALLELFYLLDNSIQWIYLLDFILQLLKWVIQLLLRIPQEVWDSTVLSIVS